VSPRAYARADVALIDVANCGRAEVATKSLRSSN
jgi:hypothetical protein